ncbi:tetratricopeptide repeat protein [Rhodobacter aestuarii]|uniref:Tetratricopeptide repeat-containing protein n=1 Tax=Rhodobacter aestuarii TaxID=453582 RepID=A0A1N7JTD2_9RHOB|nr:tetratricopeptide repeat protein [Rhodobacter aestuarii]PTV95997.1 tetratricopeptide repeat protein [Rhodobacter aestuarii]SIS52600.1 Tetratricopeptide repeat-containing protein [Rhodobacter aestuarii]
MSTSQHAANVLVSVLATASANSLASGAGAAVSGLFSLAEVVHALRRKPETWAESIATRLDTAFQAHHLSDTEQLHLRQMIEQARRVAPAEVMAVGRDPERLCTLMMAGLRDPALTGASSRARFTQIVAPLLRDLMAQPEIMEALRPAFEEAVLSALNLIAAQVEALTMQMQDTAMRLGEQEALVRDLARRYAPGSEGSFDSARIGLEQALEAAQRLMAQGTLPSNLDAAVQAVQAEVARRVAVQDLDGAADITARELERLAEEVAQRQQAQLKLLDTAIDLARARNRPEEAAEYVLAKLRLEGQAEAFQACGSVFQGWYERGAQRAQDFDLQVALAITEHLERLAQSPTERNDALTARGMALNALGRRAMHPEQLIASIDTYRRALTEVDRTLQPNKWASTQHNLGNALHDLGLREEGTASFEAAISVLRCALEEKRRDLEPQSWARTQTSLGNALMALGRRQESVAPLEKALEAYLLALEEQPRAEDPQSWARTENNMAGTLAIIGLFSREPDLLVQSLEAYHALLAEWDQERMPLYWAHTNDNIGCTELDLFEMTNDPTLPQQALDRLLSARAIYESVSPYHLERCDAQIARARKALENLTR